MKSEMQKRAIIKGVKPQIEGGRFPVKRVVGQIVQVEADIFADGHDSLAALLLYRHIESDDWIELPMTHTVDDRWRGSFKADKLGRYFYTILAWVDHFKSWRQDLEKRIEAGQQDIQVNILIGARIIAERNPSVPVSAQQMMAEWAKTLQSDAISLTDKIELVLSDEIAALMEKYPDKKYATLYSPELELVVDPVKALFGTWYEMFPRSCSAGIAFHGTFKDCESQLAYIAGMGFDILYLPPVHPIGLTNRKGKNNSLVTQPEDPGTPWAIGSKLGGHKSIHTQLGTLEDFNHFLLKAGEYGIEIALDVALQCSPDHPYIKEHPEWFIWKPDGTIQYAENPPKKYQDIYPMNFETDDCRGLWDELKSIFVFWIEQGIRIFRVDNPHTKSFYFWEWLINEVKQTYPDVIFLAEAFTRPTVMYHLAQLGFSQSYTYFAWRNTKWELTRYFTEIIRSETQEYFRPNLWPNTPDILTEYLQSGGRPAFMVRLILAATLGASYGIYGPAFELCENSPRERDSEEYLNSEKYEIKHWDIKRPDSLADFIARVNRIRKQNPALQENNNLLFHQIDNDRLICYTKNTEDFSNIILVVVNLDPHYTHSGWLELPMDTFELDEKQPYQVHDLLSGERYLWYGSKNYVELNPGIVPAHIFQIRRRIRNEKDFDYYL